MKIKMYGYSGTVEEIQITEMSPNTPLKFKVEIEGNETIVEVSQTLIEENPENTPFEIAFTEALEYLEM